MPSDYLADIELLRLVEQQQSVRFFSMLLKKKSLCLLLGCFGLLSVLSAATGNEVSDAQTVMHFFMLYSISIPLALVGESVTASALLRHKQVYFFRTFLYWLLLTSLTFLVYFMSLWVHPVLVLLVKVAVVFFECEVFRRFLFKRVCKQPAGVSLSFGYCFIVTLLGNLIAFLIHLTPVLYLLVELRR